MDKNAKIRRLQKRPLEGKFPPYKPGFGEGVDLEVGKKVNLEEAFKNYRDLKLGAEPNGTGVIR